MLSQDQTFDDRDLWCLLADQLSLLLGMTDTGRLGFAIQLKFRQTQGHYPESINQFPSGIVHAIAEQIGCASVSLENTLFRGGRPSGTDKLFWTKDSYLLSIKAMADLITTLYPQQAV